MVSRLQNRLHVRLELNNEFEYFPNLVREIHKEDERGRIQIIFGLVIDDTNKIRFFALSDPEGLRKHALLSTLPRLHNRMIEASLEPKTFGFKNALRNSNLHETGGAQSFSKPPRFLSPHRK